MTNKDSRELQRERQERGEDFQAEIRSSWTNVSNCWRMRIKDGGGGTRPADEIVLLEDVNILVELKRTESDRFELSYLRPDQVKGLLLFDRCIARNYGLVFISFNNLDKGRDEAYAFRLARALHYMQSKERQYVTLEEFTQNAIRCVKLPRIAADNTYDLKGLVKCCKSL
ncbi:hypothetical protein [Paenibacillus sinopodophylli]|uniref:hypothetical protein n=1 Tax=Paenibacillus sinopodophylli TaxID=1837342 RepID=UPI001FEC4B32|nr:hypothetical protein [Paenibacillus sinopodophylli]